MKTYFVYILTSQRNTVLYIGVTNNLERRMSEHKQKLFTGFTKRYNLNKLVFMEAGNDVRSAIAREKQIKNWHRDWKWNLIKQQNPDLRDLSADWG